MEINNKKNKMMKEIERQFEWMASPWHYELAQHFDEPIKVYSWFKNATLNGKELFFRGFHSRLHAEYVRRNYQLQMRNAGLGDLKFFYQQDGIKIDMVENQHAPLR